MLERWAMHQIIVDKPYRFVPSRPSRIWGTLIRHWLPGHLRRTYGVVSGECMGVEHLRASLDAGHGILLAANHCRPCDPMVLGRYLAPAARTGFHTMASWHLFMQSRLQSFLLPRMGAFSVYREGLDRESLNHATQILTEAKRPLVVFPEGFITRSNDRLANLMDGVAFMARLGAKQAASINPHLKAVIHPVFIRYQFQGNVEAAVMPVLQNLEARISWRPQSHLSVRERVQKLGAALLSLKELEHLGHNRSGPIGERVASLMEHLLSTLEAKWINTTSRSNDPMERIKRLRTVLLPDLIDGVLTDKARNERWSHFADLYLVQQLHCYPDSYLAGSDSPERLLETVERFEEDLTDQARPHGPIHSIITVGEAIEVAPARPRGLPFDPVTGELRQRLEGLMAQSVAFSDTVHS